MSQAATQDRPPQLEPIAMQINPIDLDDQVSFLTRIRSSYSRADRSRIDGILNVLTPIWQHHQRYLETSEAMNDVT